MGQQRIALEYHSGIALIGGQGIDGLTAQINLAFIGAFKAGDHAQGGGLAAAGRAQQGHEGTGLNLQRGVLHCIKILTRLGVLINLGNMVQAYALFLFCHINLPP